MVSLLSYINANDYQLDLVLLMKYLKFSDFAAQTPAINVLREKVRYAGEENNPEILTLWFMAENVLVDDVINQRRQLYQAQFYLLLEVITDSLLPNHWRELCLNNIYRPLVELNRVSNCQPSKKQLRHLWLELSITSNYFQSSLQASSSVN